MSQRDNSEPEDIDATFTALVANLDSSVKKPTPIGKNDASATKADINTHQSQWRSNNKTWEQILFDDNVTMDEGHYVPPEPPPLPRPRKGTLVAFSVVLAGLLLAIVPQFLGVANTVFLLLGAMIIALGIVLLLLRDRPESPPGADPETGAQV